jgi:hypothetical protein
MGVLWSGIRIGGRLRYNAPPNVPLNQRALSLSVFGFVFSDVSQVLFKCWQLSNETPVEPLSVLALITSFFSITFNLIFKIHSMLLWQSEEPADAAAASAVADGGVLVEKDVSLVLCQYTVPPSVRQLQLQAIELDSFYTDTVERVKAHGGVVLVLQGGGVLCVFNVHRRSPQHAADAVCFAQAVTASNAACGRPVVAAVESGTFAVGLLGSISIKAMHCFGHTDQLHRMCGVARQSPYCIILSGSTVEQLGAAWLPDACAEVQLPSGAVTLVFPRTLLSRALFRLQQRAARDPAAAAAAATDAATDAADGDSGGDVDGDDEGAPTDDAADEHLCALIGPPGTAARMTDVRFAQVAVACGVADRNHAAQHMELLVRLLDTMENAGQQALNVHGLSVLSASSILKAIS